MHFPTYFIYIKLLRYIVVDDKRRMTSDSVERAPVKNPGARFASCHSCTRTRDTRRIILTDRVEASMREMQFKTGA